MLIIIKTKKQCFVEIGFFSAQEFRALYQIMQENILGAKMRQAIDHFLYTNVNTFLVLCYHLLTYIQFNFNHHVIGIKKFIILCSLWSVTRIYANLSKQRKKFTLPGNQFSCIKRVNRTFLAGMLFCFTISPDLVMFLQRTVSFKCSSIQLCTCII